MSLSEIIKIVLGEKVNYSLYELVNGVDKNLPSDLTTHNSSTNNLEILRMFQYMRIIDLVNIFLGTFTNQVYPDEQITPTTEQTQITKSKLKTSLAKSFNQILNKNSNKTLYSLLLLNKLNIFYRSTQNMQNQTVLIDIRVYNFFQDMAQYFYEYYNNQDNHLLDQIKQLYINIFEHLNIPNNRKVSYIYQKFLAIYGSFIIEQQANPYKDLFDANNGLIFKWLRYVSSEYAKYKIGLSQLNLSQLNLSQTNPDQLKTLTNDFYKNFFNSLKTLIIDIIRVIMDDLNYYVPIERFLNTFFDYAIAIIYDHTDSSFIDYIGKLCLIENYEFQMQSQNITRTFVVDATMIINNLTNNPNYYILFQKKYTH
jgi:hypothetical protein